MAPIRLATRGSAQAVTQANTIAGALRASGAAVELVLIETLGDRTQAANVPLHSIGGQGVFVKEVQRAVLDGHADLAVHSAKDLPSQPTPGLTIGAFAARRSAADGLVGRRLDELDEGATVATGSVRRRAQLRRVRPDLRFAELRGNIHSRLDKIPDAGAIVMAVAALEVLDLTDRIDEVLDPQQFVPAVAQGCVAVECRDHDTSTLDALAAVDDAATRWAVSVERAYLAELGAGCALPVGGHVLDGVLHTYLAELDSAASVAERHALTGELEADMDVGRRAGRSALAALAALKAT